MNQENPGCKLMKCQGMLQYFSLALSGSSATCNNIKKPIAVNSAITMTKPYLKMYSYIYL
jgi:hypothetical protein